MAHIPNKARERLAAGQLALGMALRQARTVEIGRVLAACGFDFAFVDMEHNTMSIDTAAQIAVACHDAGVTPLVRVPGYEHHLATRLLDAGAMGIVFPHVDTPEHAKQLVSNCKYPPMGHRSLGGPVAQLGFRPYPRAEATALVNTETLLVMMLETPKAIDNAEALAAVPGVDVLLIGTNWDKSDCVIQEFAPAGGWPHRIFPCANIAPKISAEFAGGAPRIVTKVLAICRTPLTLPSSFTTAGIWK